MAVTKAARKGGMVAHIMRDDVTSLCGRVMVVIPGGEGKRLCKSCARIKGMVITTSEIEFTESEWEFIRTPRDAFFMSMVHDVLNDYAETGDNDPRRIAIYNAIVEHHTMAATEIVVINAPGGNRGGDGMVNRNSKSVAKPMGATENQRRALRKMESFMDSLINQIRVLKGESEFVPESILTDEKCDAMTRKDIDNMFTAYSRGIDRLKEEVSKLKREAVQAERKESKINPAEDGFYILGDTFVTVKWNRAKTGQYATVWSHDTESWEYDGSQSRRILADVKAGKLDRVDAEAAKRFGDLYGRCMKCSRTLTEPTSIERGIGPICADKLGL